ncbi:uncharacterized protein LOC586797 [Strongylocentrotus purpuratus]|uniref:Death domain-containing protein n=1 Tax=Strongylocentrotus purpuratus TaxID=7668 RepID=A0A7M7SV06_STRPU|nr:uncharacterized protein LOC586797 [Strongylocentrotus purpuratus]
MAGVEHMAGIDEKLLAKLGKEGLGNHDNVPKLGRELGFNQTQISLYIETNYSGGRVGTKGTVKLLFDWKKNTTKARQVSTLRAALIMAGFEGLAEEYFPEISSHPTDDSSPDLTSTSSTPDLMVTASQPMPDLISSTLPSSPNPGTASVDGQTANPSVDSASDQPQSSGAGSMATITGKQIIFLSQSILPSCYNVFCTHLGFEFAIFDGVKSQKLNDIPAALVDILNRWAANTEGLLSDLDKALTAAGCTRLVYMYKDK